MNLYQSEHPFLVGIKGIGMTALALIGKQLGKPVTGSDRADHYLTDPVLNQARIAWQVGFEPQELPDLTDYLIATAAHGGLTNPQVVEAKKRQIEVVSYAQALGDLTNNSRLIAPTGVGGKTTTTAMIAAVLTESAIDPSFVIGAAATPPRGVSGYLGQGEYFVAEADDYVACPITDRRPKFLFLKPEIVVMTNLEYDHPDVYASVFKMAEAYQQLAQKIPARGLLVVNADCRNLDLVLKAKFGCPVVKFGFLKNADFKVEKISFAEGRTRFLVKDWGEISLRVPGKLNARNALAALIVAEHLGVSRENILTALANFSGISRRFEFKGEVKGALVYDDYAHLPNEIKATLEAARDWFPGRRLRVVFQPHTYSRTRSLFTEFVTSLKAADEVILTEIFPSQREKIDPSLSSAQLVKKIGKTKAVYFADLEGAGNYLAQNLQKNDLILTLGAGDIYRLADRLIKNGTD